MCDISIELQQKLRFVLDKGGILSAIIKVRMLLLSNLEGVSMCLLSTRCARYYFGQLKPNALFKAVTLGHHHSHHISH